MKVILLPFGFYPDAVGGTEVYVASLGRLLQQRGVEVIIAAPGGTNRAYVHNGLPVRRFATQSLVKNLRLLYGEGDDLAAGEFIRILEEERPDIIHLHAFTSGVSLKLVRAAKARNIPVVVTYHTPTVSCQRGTMMRWGIEPCNGLMDLHVCACCTLNGLTASKPGLKKMIVPLAGALSPAIGLLLGRCGRQGGLWTALRMTELVKLRHATVRKMFIEADHIVAVCAWVKDVLGRNGVPEAKITLSRQGVALEPSGVKPELAAGVSESQTSCRTLRLCFLGRLDPTKGLHILLEAVRSIPEVALELNIYGVAQGETGRRYEAELRKLAANDERIRFCPPVRAEEVMSTIKRHDLLVAPSQWLETGPLVVLEAFAAGVPVVGSRRGGIAELVQDGVDGILVEADSIAAWASALGGLASEPGHLQQLRAGVKFPKTMEDVAEEMQKLYDSIVKIARCGHS